jgi:hypothetical protein
MFSANPRINACIHTHKHTGVCWEDGLGERGSREDGRGGGAEDERRSPGLFR